MVLDARRNRDHKRARKTEIRLDGRVLPFCFYADGRRGIARVWVRWINERGQRCQAMRGSTPVSKELRGRVTWHRKAA